MHALPFDGRMWDSDRPIVADALAPRLYDLGDSIQDWAAAIVAECHDDELFVVGSSVGGSCALEIARAAPERVRTVMLVGAKADVWPDPAACSEAVALLRGQGVEAAWDRYWAPLFGAETDSAIVTAARLLALKQGVEDLVAGVRAFHHRRDQSHFVKTWAGRIVLVNGSCDQTPSPQVAAVSLQGARSVEQAIVSDCGHFLPMEQPDIFYQLLSEQLGREQAAGFR